MPWSNTIDIITVPGSTIHAMMEHSVSEYNYVDPSGRFLQVSGLKVKYDVMQPLGKPLQYGHNSFMVKGGDGYGVIPKTLIHHKNTGFLDKDLFISYIKKHSPLRLPVPGRITFKDENTHSSALTSIPSFLVSVCGTLIWRMS
ncbi:5'nucleotidaselike [Caligus rogercresseyi]|uniref:5'-nucleotidase n=1 Tax=Caligus rogercresseyi TaxID=217165 RepID=A0A7T8JYL4_CALRO|nr:5'nucleotidaselike [Caligus rogercresseyi]